MYVHPQIVEMTTGIVEMDDWIVEKDDWDRQACTINAVKSFNLFNLHVCDFDRAIDE